MILAIFICLGFLPMFAITFKVMSGSFLFFYASRAQRKDEFWERSRSYSGLQ